MTLATRGAEAGMLRFIRYGFMPNRLQYCGPDDHLALAHYAQAVETDDGLAELLRRFSGALPYLQLIARANRIAEPFDPRVVEAYWIGSPLLEGVEARGLYDHVLERFGPQLTGRMRELVLGKAPAGARPHHSFHVLDIHSRLGELEHTLETLDQCRIGWARVSGFAGAELLVERPALELREGRLAIGAARPERVLRQVDCTAFADGAAAGDWVTTHWGWACEVITDAQRRQLERWTAHHLGIANQTL